MLRSCFTVGELLRDRFDWWGVENFFYTMNQLHEYVFLWSKSEILNQLFDFNSSKFNLLSSFAAPVNGISIEKKQDTERDPTESMKNI